MRKLLAIIPIVLAFLVFVACSSGSGEADTTTTAPTPVTTTITQAPTTTVAEDRRFIRYEWEDEKVTIVGEIVEARFEGWRNSNAPGTGLVVLDNTGQYRYLGLLKAIEAFEVGQKIEASYMVSHRYKVFDDGTRQLLRTEFLHRSTSWLRGFITKYNPDNSISFEEFKWIMISPNNITILPS